MTNCSWWLGLTRDEVVRLLCDAYRMRLELDASLGTTYGWYGGAKRRDELNVIGFKEFLVNGLSATQWVFRDRFLPPWLHTADVLDVAMRVRRGVRDRFGVTLVPEPVFVGFHSTDPTLVLDAVERP